MRLPTRRHVVLASHPDRGVHGLGAAAREDRAGDARREPVLAQPLDQLHAFLRRERGDDVASASADSKFAVDQFTDSIKDTRGMKRANTIKPTTPPRVITMTGSIRETSPATATSTSSS